MRRLSYVLIIMALALSLPVPMTAAGDDFKLEPGFTLLFNGKNLDGWRPKGAAAATNEQELTVAGLSLARIAHRVFLASAVSETGALLIGAGCRVVDFGRRNFCGRVLAHFGVGFYVLFAQAVAR